MWMQRSRIWGSSHFVVIFSFLYALFFNVLFSYKIVSAAVLDLHYTFNRVFFTLVSIPVSPKNITYDLLCIHIMKLRFYFEKILLRII